jgi:tRNA G18 (ribose-2'-O)-methylase SpoU
VGAAHRVIEADGRLVTPPVIVISDPYDERIARFHLRDRGLAMSGRRRRGDDGGLFVAEGDLVVERALAAGYRIEAVLVDDRRRPPVLDLVPADVPVYAAGERVRRDATGLGVPLEVIALFHRPSTVAEADGIVANACRLVVLEAVDNPTNLGAIVRTAAALGMDGLLLDATSADPLARRAVRSSMGAVFTLPFARLGALAPDGMALLHRTGVTTLALTPDPAAIPIDELRFDPNAKVALLLGSERAGLTREVLATATTAVRIDISLGVDSLNVAAAAAIACYALRRWSAAGPK